ncbi:MAG: hypothetical protein GF315_03670 [candidate division Zixibacteria bacterium]|nr:hypothetical protein [candidate division Zixibacteria bacterium]
MLKICLFNKGLDRIARMELIDSMDKIQLIFFYISGFLISRLVIKVNLPQRLVFYFIGKKQSSITKILFFIILITAFLSFFIPNAIAVLTMLPVLEVLRRLLKENSVVNKSIPTVLALSVIYGANIGGMSSVTATPANGIFVAFIEANLVAGRELVGYASWLIWAIPMVLVLILLSFAVLCVTFRPWRYSRELIRLPFDQNSINHPLQKASIIAVIVFIASSLFFSIVRLQMPQYTLEVTISAGIFTAAFIWFLFNKPLRLGDDGKEAVLLTIPDCYRKLPVKGLIIAGVVALFGTILYLLRVHDYFSSVITGIFPADISPYLFLLILAVVVSFSTEALSNTVVQLGMSLVIIPVAVSLGVAPFAALLVITLSCTCAFMTPIATGVNGLAYGGVKGVSLIEMVSVGAIMNLTAALFISFWVNHVVTLIFGLG